MGVGSGEDEGREERDASEEGGVEWKLEKSLEGFDERVCDRERENREHKHFDKG